ncbi:putative F-box/kelch-repeat protein [Raphanus sativus]|uniref:F-box/kelch-repeat protein At1g61540 n=1 Tax=Raphanus sativus TaxID=3726 RepID=A0A6J0KB40_RAPSA|nr:putative F-box/kelch-repeat protein At1g61540 [Raphanus sativus]KAJ4885189.1 putative F-box/kelch-repeat protein [Raphanus sativus]
MSSHSSSSAATSGKDPPHNNKMPATEPISIWSLPDDLLLDCLARVSRLHYHILSSVSKRFRSIIASPELYQARARLNRTEKRIYFYLSYRIDPATDWYTLRRRNIAKGPNVGYYAETVPSPKWLHPAQSSTLVAVGSDIYKIGGGDHFTPKLSKRNCCYGFSVLDCRTHTWRQAPSMCMERDASATATLFKGKIYVAGGCDKKYVGCPNWVEVFDPKTQTWGSVTNPHVFEQRGEFISNENFVAKSLLLEGKLYMFGNDSAAVVYNPEKNRWSALGKDMCSMFQAVRECHCVIDDVLFFWESGAFKWYDFKARLCKEVRGVKGLPDLCSSDPKFFKVAMVDLGGKMVFMWNTRTYWECNIWCAEITLERRHGDEMWGKVEWFDSVLSTDESCSSFYVVSASV